MSETVIKVENLHKKFCQSLKRSLFYGTLDASRSMLGLPIEKVDLRKNEFWALKEINFELKQGETLGLIGQNGSGKTTLLRLINGIFPPDKGRITINGRIGALIAVGAGFHPQMTGRENIYLNGTILGMTKRDLKRKIDEIIDFAEIGDFIDSPVATYSSGMTVRLGFSIAIHADIDLLLVDEILAVGDLGFILKCFNKIGELKRNGVSTLYVSHDMQGIVNLSNSVLFLHKGQVQYYGDPSKAISLYKKTFSEIFTSEGEIERVTDGNDHFKVLDVSFNNPLIDSRLNMKNNEDLIIRILYESDVDYDDITFDIVLSLPFSGPYFMQTTNKAMGKIININKGRGYIEAIIRKIQLNNIGMYLSMAIWDKGRTEVIFWHKNYPVFFEGNPSSTGFSFFEIDYDINKQQDYKIN
jgi:lipopolysaccharide transport system ATP-binding protein